MRQTESVGTGTLGTERVGTERVGINSYAVWRSAYCPPARTRTRIASLVCSFSTQVESRRLRHTAQNFSSTRLLAFYGLALCGLLVLMSPAAQAKDAVPVSAAVRTQSRAFALGYALRVADLQAVAYIRSVESLKDVSDTQLAGAEGRHFSEDVPRLRHAQASSYAQAASLLNLMGAPPALREWAVQSAATLNAPLIYSKDAQKLAKTEPATATVLAELVEIQAIKSASAAQQTPMTLWLTLIGGKVVPWSADVGAYTAGLHQSSQAVAVSPLSSITARLLLLRAPSGAPSATRESLATLLPTGGGNLQNLATTAPAGVTSQKIIHVYETLLTLYNAEAQAETLDKSAA